MLRVAVVIALTVSALSLSPVALAAAPCAVGEEQPAYVVAEGGRVWVYEETNGVPGLQKQPCLHGGASVPADDLAAATPGVPTIPNVCLPPGILRVCLL